MLRESNKSQFPWEKARRPNTFMACNPIRIIKRID